MLRVERQILTGTVRLPKMTINSACGSVFQAPYALQSLAALLRL